MDFILWISFYGFFFSYLFSLVRYKLSYGGRENTPGVCTVLSSLIP